MDIKPENLDIANSLPKLFGSIQTKNYEFIKKSN